MNHFVIQLLALESSFYAAFCSATTPISPCVLGRYNLTRNISGYVIYRLTVNIKNGAECVQYLAARNEACNLARDMVKTDVDVMLTNTAKVEDAKAFADECCQIVMVNYNKIFEKIVNTFSDNSQYHLPQEINVVKIIHTLLTFDRGQLKELSLMNKRFLLFYFLRVDQLAALATTMLTPIDVDKLKEKLNGLMKKMETYEIYNRLFCSNIRAEELLIIFDNSNSVKVPLDIAKIIVDYSHFSISSEEDCDQVLNKITFW
jgi:hypothetical protein